MSPVNVFLNLFTAKATGCSLPSFYIITVFDPMTEGPVGQAIRKLLLYRGISLSRCKYLSRLESVSHHEKLVFPERSLQCRIVADKKGITSQRMRKAFLSILRWWEIYAGSFSRGEEKMEKSL